jgi:cysteinyl-tRNA synthetase
MGEGELPGDDRLKGNRMKHLILKSLCSFFVVVAINCIKHGDEEAQDYREDMRTFVQGISSYAKSYGGSFIIIPQNGHELLTETGESDGVIASAYTGAIDGVGREDLFYGYDEDNVATPAPERDYMIAFLDRAEDENVEVLVTDYCWTPSYVDNSYSQSEICGYASFAAHRRELDSIPAYPLNPHNANTSDISSLAEVKNFLYLINPELFADKVSFLDALATTDYDLLIIDLFFNGETLTAQDIASLKVKNSGGSRLVIAYMSIGEAEDYRYYWKTEWESSPPEWLAEQNPNWEGNYKVEYWHPEWQSIIFGNNSSYCKRILDAGFDGVYLDIIDAFEYFESR